MYKSIMLRAILVLASCECDLVVLILMVKDLEPALILGQFCNQVTEGC